MSKGFNDSVKVSTPNNTPADLSYTNYTTLDLFQLRPIFIKEMYPTDRFSVSITDYFRANPMAGACYGKFTKKYAAFFVPFRILWDKWDDFLTGGSSGRLTPSFPRINFNDLVDMACDYMSQIEIEQENLDPDNPDRSALDMYRCIYRNMMDMWSDLGIPIKNLWGLTHATQNTIRSFEEGEFDYPILMPLAVQRIWFDWFRDQNLIGDDLEDTYIPKNIGGMHSINTTASSDFLGGNHDQLWNSLMRPKPVAVEKDYFSTAAIEPQRGGAGFVPVSLPDSTVNPGFAPGTSNNNLSLNADSTGVGRSGYISQANDIIGMFDYNLVRVAKGVQRFLEKNNIAGGATLQQLLAHWGTAPNPAVFQKSTYIGSFTDTLHISEVVSPSDIGNGSAAGQVATRLQANGNGKFDYTANEHGYFVIMLIVRPETVYSEGMPREARHGCLGNGRFDFFTKELEPTGMQPQDLYEFTDAILLSRNAEEFPIDSPRGYVPRYAECKRSYNICTGQMQTPLYDPLRISRDYGIYNALSDGESNISLANTMVYGYPAEYRYDLIFRTEDPMYDHMDGWIHFDWQLYSPRASYAAPLIETSKGDDISLPYMGVRM